MREKRIEGTFVGDGGAEEGGHAVANAFDLMHFEVRRGDGVLEGENRAEGKRNPCRKPCRRREKPEREDGEGFGEPGNEDRKEKGERSLLGYA